MLAGDSTDAAATTTTTDDNDNGDDSDGILTARLASVSLLPDAGNHGEEPSPVGVAKSSQKTQTDVRLSQSLDTVDFGVQCSPITASKHTAMTDCSMVRLILIVLFGTEKQK